MRRFRLAFLARLKIVFRREIDSVYDADPNNDALGRRS